MSEIVEVLNEIVERHDCSHPAIVSKASAEITRLTAENEKLRAAIECALRQLADGNRVLATGTLADALSGDKQ
jgi:Tfp pilus assembly protein PilF